MSKYYDISTLLSYNKILNFIIGQRGGGKTFGAKKWCINDFIKKGNQFIWIRHFKQEIKQLKQNFWNDIIHSGLYPDVEFSIKGDKLFINNKICGYLIALSTSNQMKSSSFPNVNKIIFDEFIFEKGHNHYRGDEVNDFVNFMDTVIRDRDNCRAILIANNVQTTNPYFHYFGVRGDQTKRFVFNHQRGICIEFYTGEVYAQERLKTRFGQLINGTEYGNFSLYNKPLHDNMDFIETKPNTAKYMYALLWKGVYIGVWYDNKTDSIYMSSKYDSSRVVFSMTTDDHTPKMLFLKQFKSMSQIKQVKYAYSVGCLFFENQMIKRYFIDEILPLI